ncbi:alpha/beta hydrolase [Cryobacterium sp. AP23]
MTPDAAADSIDATVTGPHGPVPVRRYAPAGATARPPIVWVHGGGFFKGDLDLPETHEVARALAAAGFPVVTVDYRLATVGPRHARASSIRYPVPVDDVVAVLRDVQAEHPDGVILGGASAGACLAAGAVLRLAADGAPALRGVFLAYGFFHAALPPRSREVLGRLRGRRKYTHLPALLNLTNLNYAGTAAALDEPFAFAGGHPLHDFPPVLMLDAESDSMRASGGQFARELTDAAVPVEYHVLPGTVHAFLNRPHDPAFARAIGLIGAWAAE